MPSEQFGGAILRVESDYSASIVRWTMHVAPVPRWIRAYLGAEKILDTIRLRW